MVTSRGELTEADAVVSAARAPYGLTLYGQYWPIADESEAGRWRLIYLLGVPVCWHCGELAAGDDDDAYRSVVLEWPHGVAEVHCHACDGRLGKLEGL